VRLFDVCALGRAWLVSRVQIEEQSVRVSIAYIDVTGGYAIDLQVRRGAWVECVVMDNQQLRE
jgi:hypothetical protein